jgi:Glycosyl transferases group 1
VYDIPFDEVRHQSFDCVLFQSRRNYLEDQHEILSPAQQRLPRLYLEHDPPREHPTDTPHIVDDPEILLVHVTHFNRLMWNNGQTPTCVIEHGVTVPEEVQYSGDRDRGIVVINGLKKRGRRLGADVFEQARQTIPLDLVGMEAELLGGIGDIPHAQLLQLEAQYRFFFHPVRYTSLGLAVCEAMMLGLPIIAPATTELATVVENDVSGYIDTNIEVLIERMQELLRNSAKAHQLSKGAREQARSRFHIDRFAADWTNAFEQVMSRQLTSSLQ